MIKIEQVEKLREKANVSYDEAKTALEAANGDMLEAIIWLERQGKVSPPPNGGCYNSAAEEKTETVRSAEKDRQNGESFRQLLGRFLRWCGRLVAKGNVNIFEVWRNNNKIISVPVTVLVLLVFFAFWIVVPLIIIGLFFGCRYLFCGPDLEDTGVNRVMDSAAEAVESLKKDVRDGK